MPRTTQSAKELRALIEERIPAGLVVPEHTDTEHFYRITDRNVVYQSVSTRLQILKDKTISNFNMNRAMEYIFRNYREFKDDNIMGHINSAEAVAKDVLKDAGGIGTEIHAAVDGYLKAVIEGRGTDIMSHLPSIDGLQDARGVSALRAMSQFIKDYDYEPIASELSVYSHKLKTAGQLDDIGFIWQETRAGAKDCTHEMIENAKLPKRNCLKCPLKIERFLCLLDLKSSNQFKDNYFFQVALYYTMFREITGIKPDKCMILKLSKEDGQYKLEDLKRPAKIAQYANHLLKVAEGIEFIKSLRKDNQKKVIKL